MSGPFQPILKEYPTSGPEKHPRRFQASWFQRFPQWLEYSPTKDATFCLFCYLFRPINRYGSQSTNSFTPAGFRGWNRVGGKDCALRNHVGSDHNAPHMKAVESCNNLMKPKAHIDKVFYKQTTKEVENNRLRLKTSIDSARWLTFQGCALRGHNESSSSKNQGNFIELIKLVASYNSEVSSVVLDKAPGNASYDSPEIQKEILRCIATKVQEFIRKEIGESKFCIIVDEARDESKKEQMAIVIRFVDKGGILRERFLDIVHVKDTSTITLKNGISHALSKHNLNIQNLRGQGYDGASDMRGEWNGLQALFLEECKYAYYIHCFAHRLQLALVAASREVILVYHFFSKLTQANNIVSASSKRNDELQAAQVEEIEEGIENGEIETGTGRNQIKSLQRAGDTRWGSHYKSVWRFINLYNPACAVIKNVIREGNFSQRAEANGIYESVTSFDFVLILHLVYELLRLSDNLCEALQCQSQDIVNEISLVSTTKTLLQNFRETRWDILMKNVLKFCSSHGIIVPDMDAVYTSGRGRRHQQDHTVHHHFYVDVFLCAVDTQLQELNNRFNEKSMELLTYCHTLDPINKFKSFEVDKVCKLVDLFYPEDFKDFEKDDLKKELEHYELDIPNNPEFGKISTINELCQKMVATEKSSIYPLIQRLLCLVLTLLVSTATTERSFPAMKIVKTRLRNKMGDDYLTRSLILYIEKDIAKSISIDEIIHNFNVMKTRRVRFE